MYEEIKGGKYNNPMEYPNMEDFNKCDNCHTKITGVFCNNCGYSTNSNWRDDYNTTRKMYRVEDTIMRNKFKKDVMEYVGIPVDYPTYEKIWDKAWDDGHGFGYDEVLVQLEDLVYILPNLN